MPESLAATLSSWLTTGVKVIIALVILFVAFKIINAVARKVEKKLLDNGKLDKTLVKTLTYIVKIGLKVIVLISLAGFLGIDTAGIAGLQSTELSAILQAAHCFS